MIEYIADEFKVDPLVLPLRTGIIIILSHT